MNEFVYFVTFLLSAVGLTILIVWPETGPGAFLREAVLRKILPQSAGKALDCYVCLGFWAGLLLSPAWWFLTREHWVWFGCLMVPAIFWFTLNQRDE